MTSSDGGGNEGALLSATPSAELGIPEATRRRSAAGRYKAIFRSHYGRVVRWLTVLGIPGGEVDDVAQEVFIVAHRKLGQLRPDASVLGWLLGISRRVSATHRRSRERARAREREAPRPTDLPDPEAVAMRSEAARLLHRFLSSLPEEQRLVFVLYEMDGAKAGEIAAALGISTNTVHSRIRLMREKLARVVQRERSKEEGRNG